jgi:hypothetical protein
MFSQEIVHWWFTLIEPKRVMIKTKKDSNVTRNSKTKRHETMHTSKQIAAIDSPLSNAKALSTHDASLLAGLAFE